MTEEIQEIQNKNPNLKFFTSLCNHLFLPYRKKFNFCLIGGSHDNQVGAIEGHIGIVDEYLDKINALLPDSPESPENSKKIDLLFLSSIIIKDSNLFHCYYLDCFKHKLAVKGYAQTTFDISPNILYLLILLHSVPYPSPWIVKNLNEFKWALEQLLIWQLQKETLEVLSTLLVQYKGAVTPQSDLWVDYFEFLVTIWLQIEEIHIKEIEWTLSNEWSWKPFLFLMNVFQGINSPGLLKFHNMCSIFFAFLSRVLIKRRSLSEILSILNITVFSRCRFIKNATQSCYFEFNNEFQPYCEVFFFGCVIPFPVSRQEICFHLINNQTLRLQTNWNLFLCHDIHKADMSPSKLDLFYETESREHIDSMQKLVERLTWKGYSNKSHETSPYCHEFFFANCCTTKTVIISAPLPGQDEKKREEKNPGLVVKKRKKGICIRFPKKRKKLILSNTQSLRDSNLTLTQQVVTSINLNETALDRKSRMILNTKKKLNELVRNLKTKRLET